MGEAQGAACRDAIRERIRASGIANRGRLAASLRPFLAGRVLGSGMAREIARYYPHLSERIQGLASGSGLATDSLMEMFVRASRDELAGEILASEAAIGARPGSDVRIARSLPESQWVLRRSLPDVGFASVEVTLPWLATSVAGVNEAGVVAAVDPGPDSLPRSDAPSALLLVQECLQRFDDVTGCLDWVLKRPASGSVQLVVGDATGRVARVRIDDANRAVEELGSENAEHGDVEKGVLLDPCGRSLAVRVGGYEPVALEAVRKSVG